VFQHRQFDEIREAVARNQVVLFIGARGTGKTLLADLLVDVWRAADLAVVRLDAASAASMDGLLAPVVRAFGGDANGELDVALAEDAERPVRVIIDNLDQLADAEWLPAFQAIWRAFFTSPLVYGKANSLLLGRPRLRQLLGGRGSPLANAAAVHVAKPLVSEQLEADLCAAAPLARAVWSKTGGHPQLAMDLGRALGGRVGEMGGSYPRFRDERARYIHRLIDDHGLQARRLLARLRDGPVARTVLLEHCFGEGIVAGHDCLTDLAASGLVVEQGNCVRVDGELVASFLGQLALPAVSVPETYSRQQADAAALLFVFENSLRARVSRLLSTIDADWWPTRIPSPEIVGHAEARQEREMASRLPPATELHPLLYTNVGELFDIVGSEPNWGEIFALGLAPRGRKLERGTYEDFKSDVLLVRNKVAHHRPISDVDIRLLRSASAGLGVEKANLPRST
jgi:hypothetical protein